MSSASDATSLRGPEQALAPTVQKVLTVRSGSETQEIEPASERAFSASSSATLATLSLVVEARRGHSTRRLNTSRWPP